jgi:hypothetical protein
VLCLSLIGAASADSVTLRIGVHREAGPVHDVAVDGAAGQCAVTVEALECPATGPVTFRWGPGGDFVLTGDTTLSPGESGTAWVLAPDASRAAERARLAAPTPQDVRDLFVRTGDHPVPVPSIGMLEDLFALARHRDPLVRREVVDALVPWWRHTASDPLPPGAPPIVPEVLLHELARDPDLVVRRRLASRLRDLREPGEPLAEEATRVLLELAAEGGSVQRAAFASLAARTRDAQVSDLDAADGPLLEAWAAALAGVSTPGPPGRAAAKALVTLAAVVDPARVDPVEAVHRTAATHLERTWSVWTAWREHVPFDRALVDRLLRETIGWSPTLVRHWSETAPEELAAAMVAWEPTPPHSDRYTGMLRAFRDADHPALAPLRRPDNLSPDTPTPPAE